MIISLPPSVIFVNENEKGKCQNSKTCHSTKVLAYNTALTGATAVRHESVTNSGQYLGRSSTRLRQQV